MMKIRITGNSIRLRLGQADVRTLDEHGAIEETLHFPHGECLRYRLSAADHYGARFQQHTIHLKIPENIVSEWAKSERLSLEGTLEAHKGQPLRLLVEKDLGCLQERPLEDESDAFPNSQRNC